MSTTRTTIIGLLLLLLLTLLRALYKDWRLVDRANERLNIVDAIETSDDEDRVLRLFYQWSMDVGIRHRLAPSFVSHDSAHNSTLSTLKRIRGTIAMEHIKKGELVVAVPRRFIISRKTIVEAEPALHDYFRTGGHIYRILSKEPDPEYLEYVGSDRIHLTLFLMLDRARGRESRFAVFYRILELAPRDIPLLLDDIELLRLSSYVQNEVNNSRYRLQRFYSLLFPALALVKGKQRNPFALLANTTTFQGFLWSYVMVSSRFWSLEWEDLNDDLCNQANEEWEWACDENVQEHFVNVNNQLGHGLLHRPMRNRRFNSFMAPLADMLNHGEAGATEALYNRATDCFEIRAYNREFKAQEEVTFFYSDMCADDMLLEYGFRTNSMVEC